MIDKNLLTFFNQLRGTIGYYNFYSNAIKLIFIKYLLTFSDQLDIKDIKSYKAISEFYGSLDFDSIVHIVESLKEYRVPEDEATRLDAIIKAVDNYDYELIPGILAGEVG